MQAFARAYGPGLPKQLTLERMSASKVGRLPGLKSSNMCLEIAMNRLNKIDFEDYLGRVQPDKDVTDYHLQAISDLQ